MRFVVALLGFLISMFAAAMVAQTTATVMWERYSGASPSEMTTLYIYQIGIDEVYTTLTPACTIECAAPITFPFVNGQTYSIRFRVACTATPTSFGPASAVGTFVGGSAGVVSIPNDPMPPPPNPCSGAAPPPPVPPVLIRPCDYAPPGSSVMETRPIGQAMQGFNPIGPSGTINNQADRIRQLMVWGWNVLTQQFVDGSVRADRTDRLFLIVQCGGLR